jgi:hypothetical protein
MTAEELREAARQLVERSTREQGIPFHVEDEGVLALVAWELLASPPAEGGGGRAR